MPDRAEGSTGGSQPTASATWLVFPSPRTVLPGLWQHFALKHLEAEMAFCFVSLNFEIHRKLTTCSEVETTLF